MDGDQGMDLGDEGDVGTTVGYNELEPLGDQPQPRPLSDPASSDSSRMEGLRGWDDNILDHHLHVSMIYINRVVDACQ